MERVARAAERELLERASFRAELESSLAACSRAGTLVLLGGEAGVGQERVPVDEIIAVADTVLVRPDPQPAAV
jgi:hypothetical protein